MHRELTYSLGSIYRSAGSCWKAISVPIYNSVLSVQSGRSSVQCIGPKRSSRSLNSSGPASFSWSCSKNLSSVLGRSQSNISQQPLGRLGLAWTVSDRYISASPPSTNRVRVDEKVGGEGHDCLGAEVVRQYSWGFRADRVASICRGGPRVDGTCDNTPLRGHCVADLDLGLDQVPRMQKLSNWCGATMRRRHRQTPQIVKFP